MAKEKQLVQSSKPGWKKTKLAQVTNTRKRKGRREKGEGTRRRARRREQRRERKRMKQGR